ncbi:MULTISPECIES: c-type cytochrome [unclassified Polaromonas]|uniref:c-type cytochrome n=1 Tax=unclassified Polaromonas TaxID=2638319 RepID=UPI000F0797F9|nr:MULTISPECIES: c-type cytochrome [unclassified Polaromonas]AYQ28075.1 cytochrome C [Polaromonas sp. SP1]QGJ17061.1 cytochrome C [Polaromonas sp. Pch-P]
MRTSRIATAPGFRAFKQLALPLLCLALSPLAQAQSAGTKEALYVKSLAATCANCHGTNGTVVQGSSVTSLAGLDKGYIVAQMNAFKAGTRPATVMHQISKGYNDAQIESLATYFAAQKK